MKKHKRSFRTPEPIEEPKPKKKITKRSKK